MNPRTLQRPLLALALAGALAAPAAQAADLVFDGQLAFHNSLVQIDFTLDATASVQLWTDSWQSGLNFDPQLTLWQAGQLLAANDDADPLGAGQGYYDAALALTLDAGSYRVVLHAAGNDAVGSTLAAGFSLAGEAPLPLADWTQPSSDLNAGDQKGSFWQLHLDNVTQAAAVPEPASVALMLAGLLAVATAARRRN